MHRICHDFPSYQKWKTMFAILDATLVPQIIQGKLLFPTSVPLAALHGTKFPFIDFPINLYF
ncbi:hypothetical protein CW304_09540 [Bacillus sp. UFRGS-B20]|nr:hypothetical protein CW304_09540 [Bacillus sp. UFRGS-B20]